MRKLFVLFLSSLLMVSLVRFRVEAEDESQVDYFNLIDQVIESDTRFGLSGAQLAVIHEGEMIYSKGYGYKNNFKNVSDDNGNVDLEAFEVIPIEERVPITTDTLFDLASNTKMYGLNYAIQYLIENGDLSLDTKVADIFKDQEEELQFKFRGYGENHQSEITIEDLLMHKAGFLPDPRYHDNLSEVNHVYFEDAEPKKNPLFSHDRELTKKMVLHTPLVYERGSKHLYSDADFMLLGFIVEEITGKPLDHYMNEVFYKPLGLNRITFNPLKNGFDKDEIVASEVHGNTRSGFFSGEKEYENIRKSVVDGEVHDEKAYYSMDGVSGHAGLFGTAEDIAKLAQHMLKDQNNLLAGENPLFSSETIDKFSKGSPLNDTYGVGWRRQGANKGYKGFYSEFASENTIGHSGWTGTLTVIDPEHDLVIALFTNSRNTPQMTNADTFYTYRLNVNTYDTVTRLVYEALSLGSNKSTSEIATELFETKLKQVAGDLDPEKLENVTISERNAVRSLISTIERLSINSKELQDYMETSLFKETLLSLEANNDDDFRILNDPKTYRIGHQRLVNLYETVKNTKKEHSEASWLVFQDALSEAEKTLKNDIASQTEVNSIYDKLKLSFDSLEIDHPTDPVDPVDPVEPTDPKDPVETEKPTEPLDPKDPGEKVDDLPNTGMSWFNALTVSGIGLSLLGGLILFLKRNQSLTKENKN